MFIRARHRGLVLFMLSTFLCIALAMILGFSPLRNDPFHSPYIDNQTHSVSANSDTWFHFDYGTLKPPRTVVTLDLLNGVQSGLQFEVWAPEIISEWWKNDPTGRGMVQNVDCSTGTLIGAGPCQSKDLMWVGAFGGAGTYYVRVINNTPFPAQFVLTVKGDSVSPAPAASPLPPGTRAVVPVLPTASRTPTAAPQTGAIDDPNRAVPIDGIVHSIPGNSATWYKFDYGIPGNFQFHPQVGLRLVGAANTGVGFEVWSPERLSEWWVGKPVGRGTQEFSFDCAEQEIPTPTPSPTVNPSPTSTPDTTPAPTNTPGPAPQCTHTPTNDLTWFGGFGGPGTYFVRIVNTTPYTLNYQLTTF